MQSCIYSYIQKNTVKLLFLLWLILHVGVQQKICVCLFSYSQCPLLIGQMCLMWEQKINMRSCGADYCLYSSLTQLDKVDKEMKKWKENNWLPKVQIKMIQNLRINPSEVLSDKDFSIRYVNRSVWFFFDMFSPDLSRCFGSRPPLLGILVRLFWFAPKCDYKEN